MTVTVRPVEGLPEVTRGADIVALVVAAIADSGPLLPGDVVVVASKVLSKAEGRVVLQSPPAGDEARRQARATGMDPTDVQLVLDQGRVVRSAPGVLVMETHHGFICANAGVDRSNAEPPGAALLLPEDPDGWATRLRDALVAASGAEIAVLVSDTFGRPFRNGQVNVALGVAGMSAIRDYRGKRDPSGYLLKGTEIAVADELCAAAELVMNKLDRVPVAVVSGYSYPPGQGTGRDLLREPATDIFR